jgi:hypothetical protein
MAASYNPMHLKNIDIKYLKSEYTSISSVNELIKDWLGLNILPQHSSKENSIKYIQNIINYLNTKKEEKIGKIYWDIEAQKFLIE